MLPSPTNTDFGPLYAMIDAAFSGISLGNGVSLHESEAIERHDCEVDRFAARELDEKANWRLLVDDPELSRIATVGGPIFMDAEGFRFYLPAYLTLMLGDRKREETPEALECALSCLVNLSDCGLERFSLLDQSQRHCVGKVLQAIVESWELDDLELSAAIDTFWLASRGS